MYYNYKKYQLGSYLPQKEMGVQYTSGEDISSLKDIELPGSGKTSGMSGLAGAAPSILSGLPGIIQGGFDIAESNKYNRAEAIGGTAGSIADTVAGAFGIPTFGLGKTLGSFIGNKANKVDTTQGYSPSGNTAGYWRDYRKGGILSASQRSNIRTGHTPYLSQEVFSDRLRMRERAKYPTPLLRTLQQGGFYNAYAPSSKNIEEDTFYQMYMKPERKEYLRKLDKQYNFPQGTLEALAFKESGYGKKVDGKWAFAPKDTSRSHAGAQGPFQFMPGTAKAYGITDPSDFYQSAKAAATKFSKNRDQFGGEYGALMAYNWGSGNTSKYLKGEKDKMPEETRQYIPKFYKFREKVTGYPNSLSINEVPTVTGKRTPYKLQSGLYPDSIPQGPVRSQFKTGGLTQSKTKKILKDGKVHGKELTDKQKRFFGAVAGGQLQYGGYTDQGDYLELY